MSAIPARIRFALSRTSFLVVTDRLKVFGITKGSTIDFVPFNGEYKQGLYSLYVKSRRRFVVMYLKFKDFTRPLKIGQAVYDWSEIFIVGELVPENNILGAAVLTTGMKSL